MIYRQRHDFEPPDRPEQQQHRTMVRIALIAAATVVVLGGGVAIGLSAANTDGDASESALTYARRACEAINLDLSPGDSVETDATQAPGEEAEGWSEIADNAARAARLDDVWDELARATDAQYRAWSLLSRGADRTLIDSAVADAGAHPYESECRKALVR
ncbi:hypothetical protein [Streptomyces sp. NPDC054940]